MLLSRALILSLSALAGVTAAVGPSAAATVVTGAHTTKDDGDGDGHGDTKGKGDDPKGTGGDGSQTTTTTTTTTTASPTTTPKATVKAPRGDAPNASDAPDAFDASGASAAPDAPETSETPETPELPAPTAPSLGRDVTLSPVDGTVTVRRPGDARAIPLTEAHQLPTGTVVDARAGAVSLRSARTSTSSQTGRFSGGMFTIRQARTAHATTELVLHGGSFAGCPRTARRAGARAARVAKVVRRLWGSDKGGNFTTRGRDSVATVRGTRWLTEDRCDATRTLVTAGAVSVYDGRRHRRVLVTAGHSVLVAHR